MQKALRRARIVRAFLSPVRHEALTRVYRAVRRVTGRERANLSLVSSSFFRARPRPDGRVE